MLHCSITHGTVGRRHHFRECGFAIEIRHIEKARYRPADLPEIGL
jgi:hypothetical protein